MITIHEIIPILFLLLWFMSGAIVPTLIIIEEGIITLNDCLLLSVLFLLGPTAIITGWLIEIWKNGDDVILWQRKTKTERDKL